jgi:hypothetical protein
VTLTSRTLRGRARAAPVSRAGRRRGCQDAIRTTDPKGEACPKPDELVKLDALRQSGMLSQEEFVTEKAKLLS